MIVELFFRKYRGDAIELDEPEPYIIYYQSTLKNK